MVQARSQSEELAAAKQHAEGMDAQVLEYLTFRGTKISHCGSQSEVLAAAKQHTEDMDAQVLEYLTSGTRISRLSSQSEELAEAWTRRH